MVFFAQCTIFHEIEVFSILYLFILDDSSVRKRDWKRYQME